MTTVVIVIDGDERSTGVARCAVDVFGEHSSYHLAMVAPPPRTTPGSDNVVLATADGLNADAAREALDLVARNLPVPVTRSMLRGDPAEVVPALARRLRADVVVMAAPPTRLGALVTQDSARLALRDTSCDVLLVSP